MNWDSVNVVSVCVCVELWCSSLWHGYAQSMAENYGIDLTRTHLLPHPSLVCAHVYSYVHVVLVLFNPAL